MSPQSNQSKKEGVKAKTFTYLSVGSLFLMGLFWSLDKTFVYIFLGASLAFAALAFRERRQHAPAPQQPRKEYTQPPRSIPPPKTRTATNTRQNPFATLVFIALVAFVILVIFLVDVVLPDAQDMSSQFYYETAENFRINGQYDSADRYYREVLRIDPAFEDAWIGRGYVFMAKQNYDSSTASFRQALTLEPGYDDARYGQALVLYFQRRYRESLEESRAIFRDNPRYFDATLLAGDNYYIHQQYDSAFFWYSIGYDNGLRNPELCHILGYLYDRKANTERAIALYREALQYDSTRVDVYQRLGELYPGAEGQVYRNAAVKYRNLGY